MLDEELRVLKGQIPFLGIQQTAIEWTQVPLQPDSEAEKLWLSQEVILANDAQADGRVRALGLEHLAVAAGVRHTALAPLNSGGHMLGYMQVGNKQGGNPFDQDDMRMLAIIAGQVAPLIENTGLVQQSRRRALRAETLRRIASLTASTATLEEIIKFSVQDLARLLQAEMAFALLLDEKKGELRLYRASLFGVNLESTMRLGRLPVDDPEFPFTATGSQKTIMVVDVMEDTGVIPAYRNTALNLHGRSMVVAPLIMRDHGVGEWRTSSFRPRAAAHHLFDHTASSFPAGSRYWKRRPPGNEKMSLVRVPPAAMTLAFAASSSDEKRTMSGAGGRCDGSELMPDAIPLFLVST